MNKTLAWLCVAALIAGGVLAWWVCKEGPPPDPVLEMARTDRIAEGIKETAETAVARVKSQDEKVRTEVRVVYEQVRTRVNALPPDDVADGLNAELSLFRRMEAGSGGLDGD
jgi:hypothetical protein